MRKIVFLMFLVSLFACQKEKSNGSANQSAMVNGKSNAAPAQPVPDNRETKMLTTNYWVIEYYVSPNDFENKKKNRGNWYKFNKDGTFISGHWEQQTGSGTWHMDYTTKYPEIIIDSNNDAEDCGWHMQAVTPDASEMSWVGGQNYPNYTDMVKAINLMTIPTKKQFGDEK